ncbi:hypothetical protein E8E13_008665 [Curvularia kusanoi]|uniref:AAA+ ATPase domain-containing protein n=1 Tax=Curvularia kusanoi TaxID=90978 RepID=A0A9P4WER6_CURKU|nr:hypothetical protein E8E13_008665 [Curvularia kusanoi]
MAAEGPIERAATYDMPQLPSLSIAEDGTAALNDSNNITTQDDQGAITPEATIRSLQRDLQALQSKITRIESEAGLELDSDTDDDILEFDPATTEHSSGGPNREAINKILERWHSRRKAAKLIIRKANRLREAIINSHDMDNQKLNPEPKTSFKDKRRNSRLPEVAESATAALSEKTEKPTAKGSPADLKSAEKDALASSLMLEHMHPLMHFINDYIVPRQNYLDGDLCDNVTFHDMWLLFKPGDDVIASDSNQAYRVIRIDKRLHRAIPPWEGFQKRRTPSEDDRDRPPEPVEPWAGEGDNKPFKLWCVHIDSDGSSIGPVTTEIEIKSFEGEKSISRLPVQPIRLHKKQLSEPTTGVSDERIESPSIRQQLIERGKFFITMSGIEHAFYTGPTLGNRDMVEGQVVIDNAFAFKLDESIKAPELSLWAQDLGTSLTFDSPSSACKATCCANDTVMSDTLFDQRRNSEYLEVAFPRQENDVVSLAALARPIAVVKENHKDGEIKDPEYLIMSDRVYGFVLQTRKWAALDLRSIRQVEYGLDETKTAFDNLVLPDGHRKVILSLVAQHFRDGNRGEVDIIRGKGKGLILLLHGAPGVGKTSTAEGIAEAFRRPLLQITSGDLGLTADKVGESLQRNFDLASRWGCVLLLDEADVFLASRTSAESSGDLNRNALVAVFLRVLEYYSGILFLTTNRIGDFDEAFASRIHLSLQYPQLDQDSTQKILALNISLIKKRFKESGRLLDIEDDSICAKFTEFWDNNKSSRLNGRQIRNACQTALALAEFEAQGDSHRAVPNPEATVRLRPKHFDTILKAYLDFASYLHKTYGVTTDERAREQRVRAKEQSAENARAKASHSHAESVSSHTGGFNGAHLYNQPPAQHLAPGQFVFQSSIPGGSGYVMPTQNQPFFPGHQGYQSQMPTHQGFPNMQFAGSSASMPDLSAQNVQHQANLNAQRQVNFLNPQRMPNEIDDTHAGHSAHYQGQPANPGLPSHYPPPQ